MVGGNIGLLGFAAGPDVFVADLYGLADPIASRLRLEERIRAGHEKTLPWTWMVARFADPAHWPADVDTSAAIEAERALGCDGLARVLRDVTRPLTFGNVLSNVRDSFANTRLRFEPQPAAAASELCREG